MSGIWIPKSAEPAHKCLLCGARFYEDETRKYHAHMVECSRREEATIGVALEAENEELFNPDIWDREWEQWQRDKWRQQGLTVRGG